MIALSVIEKCSDKEIILTDYQIDTAVKVDYNEIGSIEYSKEDDLLFGKVLGIKGLISYEGKTGKELEKDFKEAVDIYLDDCKNQNIVPENHIKVVLMLGYQQNFTKKQLYWPWKIKSH